MTPEEQRIAIAMACGMVVVPCTCCANPWKSLSNGKHIPNYLNDLNAMHEAERVRICSNEQIQEYFYQLNYAVGLVPTTSPAWIKEFACYALIHATAAQRAEALLKTLNLWKDQ